MCEVAMSKNFLGQINEMEEFFENVLAGEIEERFPEMERVGNLSPEDFKSECLAKEKPVILTGVMEDWPAWKKWDFEFFKEKCGDVVIKENLYNLHWTKDSTINSLLEKVLAGEENQYLQEWWFSLESPFLKDDYSIPEYFADDLNRKVLGYDNSTLWMGSKGSYTHVHQDKTYVNLWSAQFLGRKQWFFFGREAFLGLKEDGTPDMETFLNDPKSQIMHCKLCPGEVLYMPNKWWHRVKVLEDTISMNTFYITDDILSLFLKDLIAIPVAAALNADLLKGDDMMRYNICMMRVKILAKLLGFDPEDVLGVSKSKDKDDKAA